jgi:prepilin-type processing-associated H-X9-DG protein
MNFWPTYTPTYPQSGGVKPPGRETQMRWAGTSFIGRYYRRSQWTKPAERMLMADSNFWLFDFQPTLTTIAPQNATRVYNTNVGANHIDRYRHGKYPNITGSGASAVFNPRGGKVAFNVLYVDGHATTLFDIKEGYKAIRMRYPGP